jgi:hypothetical protein
VSDNEELVIHLNAFECHEPRGRDIQMNRMLLVFYKRTVVLMEIEDAALVGRVKGDGGVTKRLL